MGTTDLGTSLHMNRFLYFYTMCKLQWNPIRKKTDVWISDHIYKMQTWVPIKVTVHNYLFIFYIYIFFFAKAHNFVLNGGILKLFGINVHHDMAMCSCKNVSLA